ncbi:hypothetical protein A3860_29840 [Niastella vici]|uniref:DUF4365 domain-containing protein n=1 Tax=Niastella vici TaxID=1703345 RepID=A0A1V9FU84_9BACT|nr:DUF4365 domain-containing protein [Niastella vici]OQP61902.1 hypothetical protein A3860_29840 [Niastella vici]
MAFSDYPQVDDASERADESSTSLMALFSQANGFICRPLPRDTGVDFMVELVTERQKARGWHFGVQLKSVSEIETVNQGQMISYSFKTSRLHYLGVNVPNLGMVVIYDYKTKQSYYELASLITKHLFDERGNSDWEQQDTVNIHVPTNNKLDSESIPTLHAWLVSVFNNAVRMNDSYGGLYGLPRTSMRYSPDDFDLNSPQGIISYLEKNGTDLLINYQLGEVSRLIARLTDQDISEHTSILCLAATARSQAGRFNESHVLCRKALRRSDLTEDQRIQILYEDIKNRFKLGKVSLEDSITEMAALKERPLSTQSRLTIAVNQLQAQLANGTFVDAVTEKYRQQIFALFDQIEASNLPGSIKFLLNLWNADNYSLFINLTFTVNARAAHLGTFNDWVQAMQRIMALDKELLNFLETIAKRVEGQSCKLVRAYTLQIHVKHMVTREIGSSFLRPERNNFEGFQKNLQANINLALNAVNYFNEEGVKYEAYVALRNALELLEIGRFKLGKALNHDIDGLYELLKTWEDEMLLDPVDLQVPGIFERAGLKATKEGEVIADFTDEQNQILSRLLSRKDGMSTNQLGYLIGEINSYQEVFKRCPPDEIGVRSIYQPVPDVPRYDHPVRYVLIKKSFNFESSPSYDIFVPLKDWGYWIEEYNNSA